MNIKYVEPPVTKRGRRGYSQDFIDALREDGKVGEWALLRQNLKSGTSIHNLRQRYTDCEFTARRQDDGKYSFYVRLRPAQTVSTTIHTIATFDPSDDFVQSDDL